MAESSERSTSSGRIVKTPADYDPKNPASQFLHPGIPRNRSRSRSVTPVKPQSEQDQSGAARVASNIHRENFVQAKCTHEDEQTEYLKELPTVYDILELEKSIRDFSNRSHLIIVFKENCYNVVEYDPQWKKNRMQNRGDRKKDWEPYPGLFYHPDHLDKYSPTGFTSPDGNFHFKVKGFFYELKGNQKVFETYEDGSKKKLTGYFHSAHKDLKTAELLCRQLWEVADFPPKQQTKRKKKTAECSRKKTKVPDPAKSKIPVKNDAAPRKLIPKGLVADFTQNFLNVSQTAGKQQDQNVTDSSAQDKVQTAEKNAQSENSENNPIPERRASEQSPAANAGVNGDNSIPPQNGGSWNHIVDIQRFNVSGSDPHVEASGSLTLLGSSSGGMLPLDLPPYPSVFHLIHMQKNNAENNLRDAQGSLVENNAGSSTTSTKEHAVEQQGGRSNTAPPASSSQDEPSEEGRTRLGNLGGSDSGIGSDLLCSRKGKRAAQKKVAETSATRKYGFHEKDPLGFLLRPAPSHRQLGNYKEVKSLKVPESFYVHGSGEKFFFEVPNEKKIRLDEGYNIFIEKTYVVMRKALTSRQLQTGPYLWYLFHRLVGGLRGVQRVAADIVLEKIRLAKDTGSKEFAEPSERSPKVKRIMHSFLQRLVGEDVFRAMDAHINLLFTKYAKRLDGQDHPFSCASLIHSYLRIFIGNELKRWYDKGMDKKLLDASAVQATGAEETANGGTFEDISADLDGGDETESESDGDGSSSESELSETEEDGDDYQKLIASVTF